MINVPGIITLYLITAEHYYRGKGACSTPEIASTAKVAETLVQNIYDRFKAANLVYEVEGDTKGFLPARALNTITLDSLIACIDEDLTQHFSDVIDPSPELVQMFQDIQNNQVEVLKNTTVGSLLETNN